MAITQGVAWGSGTGIDGREAARQAVQQALERMGTARPTAAVVLTAQEYPMAEIFGGLGSLPGGLPVWGMSASRPFSTDGDQPRSVILGLLSGIDWKAQSLWQPQFSRDSATAGRDLVKTLSDSSGWRGLLLAADGIQGDTSQALPAMTNLDLPVSGALACGEVHQGKTYQFGGSQWGHGALSGLAMGGRLRLSSSLAQGWQDTGIHFSVTKASNVWLQGLNGQPAAEAYAQVFGVPARQWAFPPHTQLARLYPLGIEVDPRRPERIVRSPLQVEVDGSFRMNTGIGEGQTAHLMVGDPQLCIENARQAVRQALAGLGRARPVLLLAFIDLAWQMLLSTHPHQLENVLREEAKEVPLLGAYTLGQVMRPGGEALVRFFNQACLVTAIGEEF
jgi:hypothetical protein